MDKIEQEHKLTDSRDRRNLKYIEDNAAKRQAYEAIEGAARLTANVLFLFSAGGITALLTFIAQKGASQGAKQALYCFMISALCTILLTGVMYLQRLAASSVLDHKIANPKSCGSGYETADNCCKCAIIALWLIAAGCIFLGGWFFATSAALA